jgi:hypothetical protein
VVLLWLLSSLSLMLSGASKNTSVSSSSFKDCTFTAAVLPLLAASALMPSCSTSAAAAPFFFFFFFFWPRRFLAFLASPSPPAAAPSSSSCRFSAGCSALACSLLVGYTHSILLLLIVRV